MSIYTDQVSFSTTDWSQIRHEGGRFIFGAGNSSDIHIAACSTIGLYSSMLCIAGSEGYGTSHVVLTDNTQLKDAAGTVLIDNGVWQLNGSDNSNKEIVIGPNPDSTANVVSIELAGSHFGEFTVTSISLLARNTNNLPTTSPLYLSIWKQVSGENYSLLAVSKEAKAQVWGEWTKWEFDSVELTGGRIRIAAIATPETPFASASQIGIQCQAREDDDSCLLHGPKQAINCHPAMILRSDEDAKYASISHVSDEDKHLREGERAKWNTASTNAQAALNNTTTLANNLAQEKNDALQHLYWHHAGNYTALAALMGSNGDAYFPEALHVTQAEKERWNNATESGNGGFEDTGRILGGYAKSCSSVAVGPNADAKLAFAGATVVGSCASTSHYSSTVVVGYRASTNGCASVVVGACASGEGVVIGSQARTGASYSIAIGGNAFVNSCQSVGVGCNVTLSGYGSIAVGYNATASGENSICIGSHSHAACTLVTVVGLGAHSAAYMSTGVGACVSPFGFCSTAVGAITSAGPGSFSLGVDAHADGVGEGLFRVFIDDNNSEAYATELKLIGAGNEVSTLQLDGEAGLGYKEKTADYRYIKLSKLFDLVDRADDLLRLVDK